MWNAIRDRMTKGFSILKYHMVCSNGGEMFERQQASELPKLALNVVLVYLFIFYYGVDLAFSQF